MFSEGTVSGLADISAFSFSPYIKQVKVTVIAASLILLTSSGEVVANGGTCTASLMYPQKKKSRGERSGE
jgi:hypothetical protein